MSVGKKILRVRLQSRMTQQQVCDATGLAPSYLSRLENSRITPSISTLTRIAEALNTPLTEFFDQGSVLEPGDHCPVSVSGRCILDQLHPGRGRHARRRVEAYSTQQLEILRQCNYLLQMGDKEITTTLANIIKALLVQNSKEGKGE